MFDLVFEFTEPNDAWVDGIAESEDGEAEAGAGLADETNVSLQGSHRRDQVQQPVTGQVGDACQPFYQEKVRPRIKLALQHALNTIQLTHSALARSAYQSSAYQRLNRIRPFENYQWPTAVKTNE